MTTRVLIVRKCDHYRRVRALRGLFAMGGIREGFEVGVGDVGPEVFERREVTFGWLGIHSSRRPGRSWPP